MNRKGFVNIVIVILVVALAGVTVYWVLTKKSVMTNDTSQTSPANVPSVNNQQIQSSEKLFTLWKDLALKFPASAKINGNSIFIDNSEFQISGGVAGICKDEDFDSSNCRYEDDKSLTNISVLRLWKNSMGVFALNPQGIPLVNSTSFFVIRKTKPNQIFTTDELVFWKGIINNYVVSSTPPPTSETANWKIYQNKGFGFEFQYPANWRVSNGNINEYSGIYYIDFVGETDNFGVSFYLGGDWDLFLKSPPEFGRSKLVTINGYTAVRRDDTAKNVHIGIKKPSGSYIIFNFEGNLEILDQILSTFKFIN